MSETLGSAVLDLGVDPAKLKAGLVTARKDVVNELGKAQTEAHTKMVKVMAAVGVAVGVGLYKVATSFEDAFNNIRIRTGATGKVLEGLKDDFREVVKDVPASFRDASMAIAMVHQRLGLIERPLQDRAKQFLTLSRITGEDLGTTIENSSRLFRNWGLNVSQQGPALDMLFRASQQSGVGINDLADTLVSFGPVLRGLGLGFDGATAMLAQFERQGVSSSTLMGGLKIALKNLVSPSERLQEALRVLGLAGKDPEVALRGIMSAIKTAPSALKATQLALMVFGRSGPIVASAIRSGSFEYQRMLGIMRSGSDTIMRAGEDTLTLSQRMEMLKNRGMLALEGPASAVLGILTQMTQLPGPLGAVAASLIGVGIVAATMGSNVMEAFKGIRAAIKGTWLLLASNPFIAVAAATIAITYLVFSNWGAIQKFLRRVWAGISNAASAVWNGIKSIISSAANAVASAFVAAISFVASLPGRIFKAALNIGISIVNGVLTGIGNLANALRTAVENALVAALNALNPFSPVEHGGEKHIGRPLAEGAIRGWVLGSRLLPERLTQTVRDAVERARQAVEDKRSVFAAAWSVLAEDAMAAFDAIYGAIRTRTERLLDEISIRKTMQELTDAVESTEARLRRARDRMANPMAYMGDALTPAERELQAAQEERRIADLASAVEDSARRVATAQRKVNEAEPNTREYEDALAELTDAQRDHEQALYNQREDGLRRKADQERKEIEAREAAIKELAEAEQAHAEAVERLREDELRRQAERERIELDARIALKRRHFLRELDDLQRALEKEGATREEAQRRILRLFRRYGVDYSLAGTYLGNEFVRGLRQSENAVERAAEAIANTVRERLRSIGRTILIEERERREGRTRRPGAGDRVRDDGPGFSKQGLGAIDLGRNPLMRFNQDMIRETRDAGNRVLDIWGWVKERWHGIVHEIVISSKKNWEEIKKGAEWLWDAVKTVWNSIKDETTRSWNRIKEAVSEVIDLIVGFGRLLWSELTAVWAHIKTGAATIWDLTGGLIISAVRSAYEKVQTIIGNLKAWIAARWDDIKTAASNAWQRVKDFLVNPTDAARDRVSSVLGNLRESIGNIWDRIKEAASNAWQRFKELLVNPVTSAIDRVKELLGINGLTDWLADRWAKIKDGVGNFATNIRDKIVDVFEGIRDKIRDFINAIIDVINILPGVEIRHVSLGARTSSTGGGASEGSNVQALAQGGKVTQPLAIVGEEAPKHPEYVIPTNPAYRGRAIALTGSLMRELGLNVPGFSLGGVFGGLGDIAGGAFSGLGNAVSRVVGLPAGLLERGANYIIDKLPSPSDYLPDWIAGLGRHAIGGVVDWVKDKVSSLFSGDSSFPGMGKLQSLVAMGRQADSMNAMGTPYLYGGGHGSFAGPWDCSGAVSAVLHAGGFLGSPITTDGLKVFGEGGDGQLVTVGVRGSTGRSAHTMMQLGNRFFESGSGHGAAWTNGWSGVFPIHRHPAGFAQGGVMDDKIRLIPDVLGWGLRKGGIMGGLPYVGSFGSGGYVPGPDGAPALATVHGGEHIGPGPPEVHVNVADGMEWLKDFVSIEIKESNRQSRDTFRAGRRR